MSIKHYRITVEAINSEIAEHVQFEYQDREDLFNTIDKLKQGSGLEAQQATKMALALRLLGPLMIEQRKHPLFVDFMPHFKAFMQQLKSTVKQAIKS
ncbi:DUF3861 domain-containing protein [Shewanella sp. Scap07]|uniref:DUF3861 domain-containing protein n=1 Tax=Shewanella sp. Scap07 TaxID=2589987 RepID=UPI0015B86DEB|nr:DUF3861 domain-containing protein [Shewanella sp. Scap07]QLE84035.1 DUF3861 domain-containing protein [Shewanella sp. Scap07]